MFNARLLLTGLLLCFLGAIFVLGLGDDNGIVFTLSGAIILAATITNDLMDDD